MKIEKSTLYYTWHPERLFKKNPMVIEDLLELAQIGKRICLAKCLQMIHDLQKNGIDSRYRKHLGGPLWELKDRTSDGGARVYYIKTEGNNFYVYHAECKNESEATQGLLLDGLDIVDALERDLDIQPSWYGQKRKRKI